MCVPCVYGVASAGREWLCEACVRACIKYPKEPVKLLNVLLLWTTPRQRHDGQ